LATDRLLLQLGLVIVATVALTVAFQSKAIHHSGIGPRMNSSPVIKRGGFTCRPPIP
jgi:hypothetical protein